MQRDFDPVQAATTTWAGRHLTCILPLTRQVVALVSGDYEADDVDGPS